MGTSKGYQPPTTPEWSRAKGSLTRYLNSNGDSGNRRKAVLDYAAAHMQTSSFQGMASAGAKIAQLYHLIASIGAEKAFEELGLDHLIGKSSDEVFNGIIDYFSDGSGEIEDGIVKSTISQLLIDLKIDDLKDLQNYSFDYFFMKFVITYIEVDFKTMYYEKIMSDRTPDQAKALIDNINSFIAYSISDQYETKELANINWRSVEGQAIIESKCKECYELLMATEEE
ncbi:hypothetical protein [Clostridium sp. FP1]|uniref:hypothetical protein n=1 Tax=Clostridium sp. FP1 TaxID=2724076 RepID=UPI0013E9628D|nr:hypothetical protein [Clostridium sp. FP1]MBZ9634615.1 hypothetical protein [Clostridium sp. FP1]